ncbi:hypothetical protein K439DRAFT_1364008, partial [Ramaria rubella]
VLHPRYKTLYFQQQKWPDSWIDTAIMLLRKHWGKNYKPTKEEGLTISEATETSYFMDLEFFGVLEGTDELDEYLALPAHPSISDHLQHWEAQKLGGSHLAWMALDFLSVPSIYSNVFDELY